MQASTRKRWAFATTLVLGLVGAALAISGAAAARPVRAPDGSGLVDSTKTIRAYGRRYCWYENGWQAAGWYVCGDNLWRGHGWYAWRQFPLPHHHHHHHHHHPAPRPGALPGGPPGGPTHPPGGPGSGSRPLRP